MSSNDVARHGAYTLGRSGSKGRPLSDAWAGQTVGRDVTAHLADSLEFQQLAAQVAQSAGLQRFVAAAAVVASPWESISREAATASLSGVTAAAEAALKIAKFGQVVDRTIEQTVAPMMARLVRVGSFYREMLDRIREAVALARQAMDEGLEAVSSRFRDYLRQKYGDPLKTVLTAHERMTDAAVKTRQALRLHVDRSPPPRKALATSARKVRGPNPVGRLRLVVRLREMPLFTTEEKGFPRAFGDPHARSQPVLSL